LVSPQSQTKTASTERLDRKRMGTNDDFTRDEGKGVEFQMLGCGFKYFYVHPYLGKIPMLTN